MDSHEPPKESNPGQPVRTLKIEEDGDYFSGVSNPRYASWETGLSAQVLSQEHVSLSEQNWMPVEVEEQRIRKEARRGFQKHMLRFRRVEQMAITFDNHYRIGARRSVIGRMI